MSDIIYGDDGARPPLQIEHLPIGTLKPDPRNARTHSPKQIAQIAGSIQAFGFNSPILIDGEGGVIAGHGRLAAALKLKLETVPVVRVGHLSREQIRAYIIADNKIALNAGWDVDILADELKELDAFELDFDLSLTGFEWAEIDLMIDPPEEKAKPDPLDRVSAPAEQAVTQPGDLWQIGPHRLICGDARDAETYATLMGDARAQMIFSDPPFNVSIRNDLSALGKVRHREFAMASGEMSRPEFTAFLKAAFEQFAAFSVDGALHYLCIDWRHLGEMLDAGEAVYDRLFNLVVWNKMNGGMGSFLRSQHELIFLFKRGQAPHVNNIELGKHGRFRTNVWDYRGANSFGRTRDDDLAMHPTVKPVAMIADAILDASKPKDIILDGFAGSGSTLVAAHKTRRVGYGIEYDPLYCDVILRRLNKVTKKSPVHVATGLTFAELEEQRLTESPPADADNDDDAESREAAR